MAWVVHHGCSLDVLKTVQSDSVDSVVTDPPYGWRFMGKAWDAFDIDRMAETHKGQQLDREALGWKPREKRAQAAGKYDNGVEANRAFQQFTEDWAREAFRVLKPGGHIVVFCGPRTYHRMASGVEDAGFEIRDQLQWLFGSGFPKSMDVSQAIDKAAGAERQVVGHADYSAPDIRGNSYDQGHVADRERLGVAITAPATDDAKKWSGWGTALKPANEPIVLARKPLSEKTVAKNVLRWKCGALNIDASRISTTDNLNGGAYSLDREGRAMSPDGQGRRDTIVNATYAQPTGRWPSNVILACACGDDEGQIPLIHRDDCAVAELDRQSGTLSQGHRPRTGNTSSVFGPNDHAGGNSNNGFGDTGGASRFFYVAKTSKRERNAGLEDASPTKSQGTRPNSADASGKFPDHDHRARGGNNHPTVKPIKLMEYLIRLITPPGGLVLDPFLGSGSTGVAAVKVGMGFLGVEREAEYVEIARRRIAHAGGLSED